MRHIFVCLWFNWNLCAQIPVFSFLIATTERHKPSVFSEFNEPHLPVGILETSRSDTFKPSS